MLRQLPRRLNHQLRGYATATPANGLTVDSAREYCLNLLRKSDHPSHLLTPFIPPAARDAHLALRALNLELAQIDTATSNPILGRMRIQHWRTTLSSLYTSQPSLTDPISVLFHHHLQTGPSLSKGFLLRLLSAREQYLGGVPFDTLDALESYAENTYGSLQYLSLESVGVSRGELDHIGSHVGKLVGIVTILRGVPYVADTGAVTLPTRVLADHGVRGEDVIREKGEAKGIKDAVFEVATRANDHLITARKMVEETQGCKGLPWATFLTAVPARDYLERLEKADFDAFDKSLGKKPWLMPWVMYKAHSGKSF
ncbi:Squalene/phytoene synthase [Pyronema omphalodes]|nr:Squalene/phytoene synthase [Pyronema omphalodes]